jgi:hypothetical protein
MKTLPAESLEKDSSSLLDRPLSILKKGLASAKEVLLILLGVPVNILLAILILFGGGAADNSWMGYFGYIVTFLALLPIVYGFLAYKFALGKGLFIIYEETIRPLMERLFSRLLKKYMVDNSASNANLSEEEVAEKMENEHADFLNEMPGSTSKFIMSFFPLAKLAALFSHALIKQRETGAPKEEAMQSTLEELMPALDEYAEELFDPSMLYFCIVLGVNLVFVYTAFV